MSTNSLVESEAHLGTFLHDPKNNLAHRKLTAESVFRVALDHRVRARAACWLAYRTIEEKLSLSEHIANLRHLICHQVEFPLGNRWRTSVLIALSYAEILADHREGALRSLGQLDADLLRDNASGVTNICRGLVLLLAIQRGSFVPALHTQRALLRTFREAAQFMPLENVHPCAGHELVGATRAVQISVCLAPHCGLAYQGVITPLPEILDLERTEPFRSALARALAL